MPLTVFEQETIAADYLSSRLPSVHNAPVGIILGTGLGQWVDNLEDLMSVNYADIPGFPRTTVQGHSGRLCVGHVRKTPVMALQGRFHLYEGYSPDEVCFGLRTMALCGVQKLLITNAAGALNPLFQSGEIMIIRDQINLTGHNPLLGLRFGEPQFPDMSQLFSPRLIELVHATARKANQRLQDGVYIGILGPSLETPAETRMFRHLGADAIGMSTVLETIAAKQLGMEILGLSCLTNKNLPDCMAPTSLEEIIAVGQDIGKRLGHLFNALIPHI